MKYLTLTSIIISSSFISCGPNEKEIKEREAFIADSLTTYQENYIKDSIAEFESNEELRVHNENIEVGKSKMRLYFNEIHEQIKEEIKKTEKKQNETNKFQLLRTEKEKRDQLSEISQKLYELRQAKDKIQEEIALIEKHVSHDFQNTPEGVVKHIFLAAKNNDFSKFRDLIDPYGPSKRSDAYNICLIEVYPKEKKQDFIDTFKNGRIMGAPKIEGNKAKVEIAYGISSNKLVSIRLVKRMSKWYLF